MKSDLQLQRDLTDELAWEPSVDAAAIGVTADSGIANTPLEITFGTSSLCRCASLQIYRRTPKIKS
jgi:hypothetical protein